MKLNLLRHFHSINNEVSTIGHQQMEELRLLLKDKEISCVLATGHPRVINSAILFCEMFSLDLEIIPSNVTDCIQRLGVKPEALVLSQQPILVELANLMSNKGYEPSHFLTGKLVGVDVA